MKKFICFILAATVLFLVSCKNGDSSVPDKGAITGEIAVNAGYVRYDVGKKLPDPIVGFGAQMDTDIFMPYNKMTEEDEALWEERIKDMNIRYTRIKMFPEFFERANDNDDPDVFDWDSDGVDFDCAEMQALYKILDLCEKYDIKADLSWYDCWSDFKSYDGKVNGSWLAVDQSGWAKAPKDFYEYAENISACLQYLINVKKYTCLWGFSNIAEGFIDENNVKSWPAYVESCRIIDEKLKKDGIRDKIRFISSTERGMIKYFKEEYGEIKDYFDVVGLGNYSWDNNDPNEAIYSYYADLREAVDEFGVRDIVISEFCEGKHFTDAVNKTDIDDYTAGLYIARFCINAASEGVTGFDHYILGDVWFTDSYVHTMGLWMYRDSNVKNPEYISWAAHPEYYFYGLICKYNEPGSYVYRLDQKLNSVYDDRDPDICCVAFNLPDGSWSYYLANSGSSGKKIAIVNALANRPARMNCYKITEAGIPEDRACVLPSAYTQIDASDGVAYVTVPANGFVVVSDRK
ncbi:MAG: hypothetical protein IJR61_06710 [Clostridia bacterium]|nr:hypothetical protein [Clostridia bacterium]